MDGDHVYVLGAKGDLLCFAVKDGNQVALHGRCLRDVTASFSGGSLFLGL